MVVKEIVLNYLRKNSYDGLASLESPCYCELDNLFSKCKFYPDWLNCVPAKKVVKGKNCVYKECIYYNLKEDCYCLRVIDK